MPPAGLDNLKHIVVLMMENRSFDHMLGALKKTDKRIDGLNGNESNPGIDGKPVTVQDQADYRDQLVHDPDHHFPGTDLQIFGDQKGVGRVANMQGFVKSYYTQTKDANLAKEIMNYFRPEKLPVLTTLATEFAVFNHWFSSIPGPTICNRAFAHYGTSFGQVGMNIFYIGKNIESIYGRMIDAGKTAKIYYYDQQSSTMEIVNLLQHQPEVFGAFSQFIADCKAGKLPDYSFIEPAYNDHPGPGGGEILASDQHPTHDVYEGERFISMVYNAIRGNDALWSTTALLVVYDEHGGLYDHVVPPDCKRDGFTAQPADTGTGMPFAFDRLGVRVPAILISPYVPKGTVVDGRIFEHACIPNTITQFFLNGDAKRTDREAKSETFLDLLSGPIRTDDDIPWFEIGD
jgi:phospholipase C